jgi:hypothetical protein
MRKRNFLNKHHREWAAAQWSRSSISRRICARTDSQNCSSNENSGSLCISMQAGSSNWEFKMDGATLVANEALRMHVTAGVGVGAGAADPAQVTHFEHLMKEGQVETQGGQAANAQGIDRPGVDFYVPRAESPMELFSADMMRVGEEISKKFRKSSEQMTVDLAETDFSDPGVALRQLAEMQKGMYNVSFQLQFVSSLVSSANRGIATLFHMQN